MTTTIQPEVPAGIDKCQYAENVAYVHFVMQNSKHLQLIKRSPDKYSCWDCSGITTNNQRFIVEFKIRNNTSKDYTGWMIENKKLKALQAIWMKDKTVQVIYICYLNDCCISFNLSQRFRQGGNSDILSTYYQTCQHSTYNDSQNYEEDKLVNHLHYNQDFNDKIIKYEK
jgi:hypothetical protein